MIIAIVQFSHHPCVIREEKTNLLHPAQRPKTKHEAQTLPKMETCSSNSHHIKVMIPMTLGLNLASTKRMRRIVPSVVEDQVPLHILTSRDEKRCKVRTSVAVLEDGDTERSVTFYLLRGLSVPGATVCRLRTHKHVTGHCNGGIGLRFTRL